MINVLSKTGGPDFHGTLYSFLNDRRFNARNFFDFSGRGGRGPDASDGRRESGAALRSAVDGAESR